ncbi:DUF6114 domain-containing protein, partial [Micromonospora sp. BL4]|uniref:DUF6114 domain-containing protein n=1 Tax=Micromonospora sp. BL4 TaxID=2478710 RepID=UPI001F3631B0
MTTDNPSHARPGDPARAWRIFRRWQRSRPFWGGLFTVLAGVEMFASTRMTLNGLSFHSGATGLLSLLIPVILVTSGLLLWLTPAQRLFYSIVAAVTAVYSLIGLNLGGFFVGLLLGMVGSALAFAWTPARPAPPATEHAAAEHADAEHAATERVSVEQSDADQAATKRVDAEQAATERAGVEQADAEQADVEQSGVEQSGVERADAGASPERPGRSVDPRTFGVVLVALGLAAAGLATQPRP